MALDKHGPVPDPAESTAPPDQGPMLLVDPDALISAARFLDELPDSQNSSPALPSAAAIGHPGLARDLAAFDQRYRDVGLALATDDETASAHLTHAAATYTRAENEASARLAALNGTRPPTAPDSTSSDTDSQISAGQSGADPDSDLRQV